MIGKIRKWRQIIYVLAFVIICIIFTGATYQGIRRLLYRETSNFVVTLTRTGVGRLEAEMETSIQEIQHLAQFLTFYPEQGNDHSVSFLEFTREFCDANGYADIYVVEQSGNAYVQGKPAAYVGDREYFAYGMQGHSFISTPVYDRETGRRVIVFGSPYYRDDQVMGLVIATKRVEELYDLFSVPFFNGDGYSYVTDGRGQVIITSLHTDSNKTANNIFEFVENDQNSPEVVSEIKKGLEEGKTWTGEIYDGREKSFLCYMPVDISHSGQGKWYIISMVPAAKLMQNGQYILYHTLVLCIVIIGLLLLGVVLYTYSRRRYQQHIEHLAYYDDLTNLFSSNYLKERGNEFIREKGKSYAYIAFDINKFKMFNDNSGYEKGNILLKSVAQAIEENINSSEIGARIGNDTFGMLLNFENKEKLLQRITRMKKAFETEFMEQGIAANGITYAFGIFIPQDSTLMLTQMMDYADIARKRGKGPAEDTVTFFKEEYLWTLREEKHIEDTAPKALENGEFVPYFQPKVSLKDGSVVGAEALVRWIKPDGTIIAPGAFISLFEQDGFICKVDYYIFEQVCRLKREMMDSGMHGRSISVNMSRNHLHQKDFVQTLCMIADRYNIPHEWLEIEVTENIYFEDIEAMTQIVMQLKKEGFLISMDDFGSGYSSLNLLKELPIDVLKIDSAFLNESRMTEKGGKIIQSIIQMADSIGVDVVCEGVETQKQVQFLQEIGCRKAQGFFYYRPMPAEQYIRLCENDN